MASGRPAPAVPAATVLLVRDGAEGLEVLLVERHRGMDFAGGASAFPGGKVEPADASPAVFARCAGGEGLDAPALALRVAAVREVFEEAGLLLARVRGARELLDAARVRALAERHHKARREGRIAIGALADREDLELACDLLVPFAHWVTPEPLPKRFDTHFFLAAAPAGQAGLHDGSESVSSGWHRPREALREAEAGRRSMMLPTRLNLGKLGHHRSVAQAFEAARASRIVTVLPRIERAAGRAVLRIPAEAGYELVEAPVDELLRRGS